MSVNNNLKGVIKIYQNLFFILQIINKFLDLL